MYQPYTYLNYYLAHIPVRYPDHYKEYIDIRDYGPEPFVINIEDAAKQTEHFALPYGQETPAAYLNEYKCRG